MQLQEEITAFERPHLMEYRITWSFPKARHELGRVEFTEVAGGTRVRWETVFSVNILGGRIDPAFKQIFAMVFKTVLRQVEQRSTARAKNQGR